MDYEQKYNKALEIIKGNLDALNEITETGATVVNIQSIRNCFYRAFPELKETEDEKIRKELIDYINRLTVTPNNIDKYNTWIAWLEKQGKEEYALKSFKHEDVYKFMQYIEKEAKAYEFNLPNRCYDIYAFAKDILVWLEKQGEQKPTNTVEPKFKM